MDRLLLTVPRLALGALLLSAAACGGAPPVPAEEAERLSAQADAVVAALEAGDGCAAAQQTEQLRQELEASADRIEPATLEQLRAVAGTLADQITCEPAPSPVEDRPEPDPQEGGDDGREDDDKGKGRGKGRGGDERGEDEDKGEDEDGDDE